MIKEINIRKVFGKYQVKFFVFSGEFYCKIGDVEFRDQVYGRLIKQIELSDIIIINEKVIHKGSLRHEVIRMMRLEVFDGYFYDEDGRQHSLEDVYPHTEDNINVMNTARELHEAGWNMIRNSEVYLKDNITRFPKDHWKKVMDKKIKARKGVDSNE